MTFERATTYIQYKEEAKSSFDWLLEKINKISKAICYYLLI